MPLFRAAGLVLLLCAVLCRADEDPVRDGKKLSEWLKVLKNSGPQPGFRDEAFQALGVVSSLGPGDAQAASLLIREIGQLDGSFRNVVADALHRIGPDAMPFLVPLLKDPSASTRVSALHALAGFGKLAKQSMAAIRDALKSEDGSVRVAAALAAYSIDGNSTDSLPILAEALNNAKDAEVRLAAAQALSVLGTDAKPAAEALAGLLKGDDKVLATQAAIALSGLDPAAKATIPVLLAALQDARQTPPPLPRSIRTTKPITVSRRRAPRR